MKQHACDICGRLSHKKIRLHGYTLCNKHMHQLFNHGKFLDNIQRTNHDLNDYIIKDDIAIFNVYNQKSIKTGEFIIDKEDLELIRYKKWRYSSYGYIVTGSGKGKIKQLSRIIFGEDNIPEGYVIDHIDNNPANNRRNNLRCCTQSENVKNLTKSCNNTSGFSGVYYDKNRNKWKGEIKYNSIRLHLKRYDTIKEAVYSRYVAIEYLYKEFANIKEQKLQKEFTEDLDHKLKDKILKETLQKIGAKFGV